jgi:hypothetical protein
MTRRTTTVGPSPAIAIIVIVGVIGFFTLVFSPISPFVDKPENVARVIAADMKTNSDWRMEDGVATNGRWSVTGYGRVCSGDFTFESRTEALTARIDKEGLTAVSESYAAMNAMIFDRCDEVDLTDASYDLIDRAYDRLVERERQRAVREFEVKTGVR